MTHPISPPSAPAGDTPPTSNIPLNERPPYGEPGSGWRRALTVGAVIALAVLAFLLVRRAWRWLGALYIALRYDTTPEGGSPMMIAPTTPYAGPIYEVRFYDGLYRQLAEAPLMFGVDLTSPWARVQLAQLASDLQRRVEVRDGQRCFSPRLELLDAGGRVVGEWP